MAIIPDQLVGANLTQGTAVISPGDQVTKEYLVTALRSKGAQFQVSRELKGATFKEITLGRLREIKVCVPPLDLQKRFSDAFNLKQQALRKLTESVRFSDELFASLSQRAFRGEL